MASVSISHLILFIASIVIAASVAGVFTDSISRVSDAIDQRGLAVSENVRTDVQIISDGGSSEVYDSDTNTITLHVKNTGSERLVAEAGSVDVLVDGLYTGNLTVSMLGDAEDWSPGEVAKLEITPRQESLTAGDHRVKIIVNADEEVFEFHL